MTTGGRAAGALACDLINSGGWAGGGCGVTFPDGTFHHVTRAGAHPTNPAFISLVTADGYALDLPADVEMDLLN